MANTGLARNCLRPANRIGVLDSSRGFAIARTTGEDRALDVTLTELGVALRSVAVFSYRSVRAGTSSILAATVVKRWR